MAATKTALPASAYKPGQTLHVTVVKPPRTEAGKKTLLRLMRMDAGTRKALRAGQEHRMANLNVRSRGGRPWEVREKSAKIARGVRGAAWTMTFVPHIGPDLAALAGYLQVKAG